MHEQFDDTGMQDLDVFTAQNPLTAKRWEDYLFPPELLPLYNLRDISAPRAESLGFSGPHGGPPSKGIYIQYPEDKDSRIRYYHDGFRAQQEDVAKYGQRKGTLPAVYYPPGLRAGWETDAELPIMITEGEFKAIAVDVIVNHPFGQKASMMRVVPLGLGGVFNWQSAKSGVRFIPRLEEIKWMGREVYIAFDADMGTNPFVSMALGRLFNALLERGARCFILTWPPESGKGIDDYLTTAPAPSLAWDRLVSAKQLPGHVLSVLQLNNRFTYVEREQKVWDAKNASYISVRSFGAEFFTEKIKVQTGVKVTPDGLKIPTYKEYTLGAYWLQSPARRAVTALQFLPGGDMFFSVDIEEATHNKYDTNVQYVSSCFLNTWKGWGTDLHGRVLKPAKGDVQPFLDFIYATFSNEAREHCEYLLKKLAWMFQQPQNKHHTWLYLIGPPRQGKSTLIKLLASLVGQAYTSNIDDKALSGAFSEWRAEKLLVTLDDTEIESKHSVRQLLKRLTTEDYGRVNKKYQNEYTSQNFFSFIYATNSIEPLLEHDDRRALVLSAECTWDFNKGEWEVFDNWLKDPASRSALLYYFLYEVKLDASFFTQDPPKTLARELVVESAASGWDEFLYNIASDLTKTVTWHSPTTGQVRRLKLTIVTNDMLRALYRLCSPYADPKFEIKNGSLSAKLARFAASKVRVKDSTDSRGRVSLGDQQLTVWTWDKHWVLRSHSDLFMEYMRLDKEFPELFSMGKGAKY